jgi:hypothetical protein
MENAFGIPDPDAFIKMFIAGVGLAQGVRDRGAGHPPVVVPPGRKPGEDPDPQKHSQETTSWTVETRCDFHGIGSYENLGSQLF